MTKSLYAIGEDIPLGIVPEKMYAYVIRKERHGEPTTAFKEEVIDIPKIGPNEILVKIKAAGVNYNGVWAALGKPKSPLSFHGKDFHIAGSDASGIIWKIGTAVDKNLFHYKEGDEAIIHCGQFCGYCTQCNGGDPMLCSQQKIWGYETPYGSFAQFSVVKPYQILPKPKHLSWEEASSYMLVLATAWRMLHDHPPHSLKPSQNVLILGGAGGLGSMAIQIVKNMGANAIAVVSSEDRGAYCLKLGATAYINRKDFDFWGIPPKIGSSEYTKYLTKVREMKRRIWAITGKQDPDIVFEHTGEETFSASCLVVKKGGMVVYCGATSGLNLNIDAAYGWMHQKRIQGSHFASTFDAFQANKEVEEKRIDVSLERAFKWNELPEAHQLMHQNSYGFGKMAISIG